MSLILNPINAELGIRIVEFGLNAVTSIIFIFLLFPFFSLNKKFPILFIVALIIKLTSIGVMILVDIFSAYKFLSKFFNYDVFAMWFGCTCISMVYMWKSKRVKGTFIN